VREVAQIGAVVSDLVAAVHALVTEGEKGAGLAQRVLEIRASADALVRLAERIAQERGR